jgi:RNA polymerase sigma-70 factor (ECF subfamily)
LFGAIGQYQPRGKFRSYLYRLLLNQCRRFHRRGRLEQRSWLVLAAVSMTSDQLIERERQRDLERALMRLPAKQRSVLLMRYTAELSYQEIAEALSVPLGTVKSRIFEATGRLRELCEES